MAHITLLVGPPGSGKSTYANELIYNDGDHGLATIHINQDNMGKEEHLIEFSKALLQNKNIIIDRMNFNKEQRDRYLVPAKQAGYTTEIVVFHVPSDVCTYRCLHRLNHPTIKDSKDASKAINFFFSNYERVENYEADSVKRLGWEQNNIPDALYVDLDGTLCDVSSRIHHVRGEKKNWKAFFDGIKDDKPNKSILDIITLYNDCTDIKIVFATGRPDNYSQQTKEWLSIYLPLFRPYDLFMRRRNDRRQDNIVKEIMLEFEIKTRYSVLMAFDDRNQVVEMLRKHGICTMQVANGDF